MQVSLEAMTVATPDGGLSDQFESSTMGLADEELQDTFQQPVEGFFGGQSIGRVAGDEGSGQFESHALAGADLASPAQVGLQQGNVEGISESATDLKESQDVAASGAHAILEPPQASSGQKHVADPLSGSGLRQSDRLQSRPVLDLGAEASGIGITVSHSRNPYAHARNPLSVEARVAAVAAQKLNGLAASRPRPEVALHIRNLSIIAGQEDDVDQEESPGGAISPIPLPDAGGSFEKEPRGGPSDRNTRPLTRTAGSYKSPGSYKSLEVPAGLVSPRAGLTSTAVLALPAPDRPHGTTAKRHARVHQKSRLAKPFSESQGRGGLGRFLSISVPPPVTEANRQSDVEGEQSGSGLLEGGGSGRSGATNSGNNMLRECSVCHLHKSPRWRTGPEGPKTLCNRCGVYWSQNRHKWDELVDRFKANSDGEVNQLQAEFKAVRYGKSADLEQRRAKAGPKVPAQQGGSAPVIQKPRKASNLGGHSRSDTETILRKLQELPGHFAKSLRKELLGFGLVRNASPKPDAEGGQPRQPSEMEEEVVISSGSDDDAVHERARSGRLAGPSGSAHDMLGQVRNRLPVTRLRLAVSCMTLVWFD